MSGTGESSSLQFGPGGNRPAAPGSTMTLQEAMDEARLDPRFWSLFSLLSICTAIDFFDYFIVGFLLSVVAPLWNLTYGETAVMLLGAGFGGIIGALLGGYLCDRFGRRPVIVACSIACGLCAGSISLIPDGAWQLFAALRFFTGIFISCIYSGVVATVTEMVPTRHRPVIASLSFAAPSAGILLSTLASATLLNLLGWRGVAALAVAPAVVGVLCYFVLPESFHWLLSKGREQDARKAAARRLGRPVDDLRYTPPAVTAASGGYGELLRFPRQTLLIFFIWFGIASADYGVYAWGPTIITLSRGVTPQVAAGMFLWVSVAGFSGKVIFSFMQGKWGRRLTGLITTGIGVLLLVLAGVMASHDFLGFPAFLVFLAAAVFLFEGGASGISPYSAEVFPVRLAGRGAGLGQVGSGVGKIVGPLGLALIAGTSNVVTPKATAAAILPGMMFLAACLASAFLAYLFFGVETRGKQLSFDG